LALAADIVDAVHDLNWDQNRIKEFLGTAVTRSRKNSHKGEQSESKTSIHLQPSNQAWPKPERLQSDLPPVEPFHEGLLPVSFRPLVLDVTERMQIPVDFAAVLPAVSLCREFSKTSAPFGRRRSQA